MHRYDEVALGAVVELDDPTVSDRKSAGVHAAREPAPIA